MDSFEKWVGRTERTTDHVDADRVSKMHATISDDSPLIQVGDLVPLLWHWMFFPAVAHRGELGRDGHPKKGGFLPPIDLPRRMWAGGRLEFSKAIAVGEVLDRTSTIKSIAPKQGRSGKMVFVTVEHQINCGGSNRLTEQHDIVYREDPNSTSNSAPSYIDAPSSWEHTFDIIPDPVTLFRYSALTFNGHRIHYDRKYCNEVEGYPGLVVHGPLIATYLVKLLTERYPNVDVDAFQFRAMKPIFDLHSFSVFSEQQSEAEIMLWAADHEGHVNMKANAAVCSR